MPDAARAYLACADHVGTASLDGLDVLDAFNHAAETVVAAVDRSALPLFAGIAAEPLPEHPAARADRNVCILRELRGSVHLLVIVASGLAPSVAHVIRRPDDSSRRSGGRASPTSPMTTVRSSPSSTN